MDKSEWIVGIVDRFEGKLVRYASGLLDDTDSAREVVQETFLRLCKEEPGRLDARIPQWLFTVTRNLAYDLRRKQNRTATLNERPTHSLETPVDVWFERQEAVCEALRALRLLPKNQREVVYLKFQCDLSYKDISVVTKLSASNVGFLIYTAIQTLRKQLCVAQEPRRTP